MKKKYIYGLLTVISLLLLIFETAFNKNSYYLDFSLVWGAFFLTSLQKFITFLPLKKRKIISVFLILFSIGLFFLGNYFTIKEIKIVNISGWYLGIFSIALLISGIFQLKRSKSNE
ncbi:hypothetical protein [Enterococcus plantarum]|uniref:hypothetical protein n=1 Tax=Enterococcus TaxID=1350 RepID=UPI001A905AF3|nr:hypothetical protein [Enterococcus plantarum]MBO0423782.1 hypothetical protein [Enterococcus plantarum]